MSPAATRLPVEFVDPLDSGALPFRNLRTSADLSDKRRGSVALLFTGAHPGEGTSTIAANHALVAGAAGRSTLLIDANLWWPALHQRLGTERRPGLADVAAGAVSLEEAIRATLISGIQVSFLPAGSPVRGTVDVLGSRSVADMIDEACRIFDTVVIDSSPVLAVTDAAVLAAHPEVDTIVVVERGQRRKRVTGTVAQLRRVGANVVGLVVNIG